MGVFRFKRYDGYFVKKDCNMSSRISKFFILFLYNFVPVVLLIFNVFRTPVASVKVNHLIIKSLSV